MNPRDWAGIKLIEDYRVELDKVVDLLLDNEFKSDFTKDHLRGQAAAFAWCIAKMQNQATPNMDAVRAEAMRRREIRKTARNGSHKRKVKA